MLPINQLSAFTRGHALLPLKNVQIYTYIHPAVVLYVCEYVHSKTVVPWTHGYIPVTVKSILLSCITILLDSTESKQLHVASKC